MAEVSNYDIVRHNFTVAADRLAIPDDLRPVLESSYREVQVQIPIRRQDGKIHVYSGYRVQHNGARGPYKGGIPFIPTWRPCRGSIPSRGAARGSCAPAGSCATQRRWAATR